MVHLPTKAATIPITAMRMNEPFTKLTSIHNNMAVQEESTRLRQLQYSTAMLKRSQL